MARVLYYIDADLFGLAKVLSSVRTDVTYPGFGGDVMHKKKRPPCPIHDPGVPDTVWLPEVASRNWLIITRDRHIEQRPAELAAVRDNSARLIALSGRDAKSKFAQLETVMSLAGYRMLCR